MDDDLVTALECCQFKECEKCPLLMYGEYCKKKLFKNSIAVIESLRTEVEDLQHYISEIQKVSI